MGDPDGAPGGVGLRELRVLDGPNLYFTRPAVKLTLDVAPWLRAPARSVDAASRRAGLVGTVGRGATSRSSAPRSEGRRRFVVRMAAHLTRELARTAGTALAVRARSGPEHDEVVVAYPWRRRGAAEALGREVAWIMGVVLGSRRSVGVLMREARDRLAGVEPGPPPDVPTPAIPVIAVTGTNGKTTTVRLLAHLARTAGRSVAYSSTDGVYLDGALVEAGDYSGFAGAARALSQPGVQMAVLETARGGILLRGIGTSHNDVAVVTNVSADHLGLHGIQTLDQLAEVKATITRITRPSGWDVLNADDPRVLGMRRTVRGRPWLFSLDAENPALRMALSEGGRGITVIDGVVSVLVPGRDPSPLLPVEDVPVTLAGLSSHNTQNALAAAAAALGAGLPGTAVVRGLRTFVLDPERNPGRTNLFELRGRVVVVDYAHNEAGMAGLVETAQGLRTPGSQIWLAFASAGDRTDEIMHGLGYIAARGADHVAVAELARYLRGRDRADVVGRLRAGAEDGGATDVPAFQDELEALRWMLDESRRGDVVAVTALGLRPEIFAFLEAAKATRVGPGRIRALVRRARTRR
jgi:cyanophycin synthetase